METTIIALALALAPSTNTPTRSTPLDVERVVTSTAEPCAHATALDSTGGFVGEVTICVTEAGDVDVDADFADGIYLALRYDNEGHPTIDSNDAPEAAERIRHILGMIDPVGDDGWVPCALGVVGTVASIVAVQPWLTAINTYAMACSCIPLLDEEFEDIDCPGF